MSSLLLAGCGKTKIRVSGSGSAGAVRTALDVLAEAVGWWEADDVSNIHSGGFFSQLTDLSGNGNHLTQATGGLQPARTDTSGVISAEFDGSNDVMLVASPTAALMNSMNAGGTSLWGFRINDGGSTFGRVYGKNTGEGFFTEGMYGEDVGAPNMKPNLLYDYATANGRIRLDTPTLAFGTKYLIAERLNKDGGDGDLVLNVGTTKYTIGAGLTTISAESGAVSDLSGGVFEVGGSTTEATRDFAGGVYPGAMWGTQLPDEDLALVLAHWAAKYAIAV